MCWRENNGGKNYVLEKFRDGATWKIANFQRQFHTHFRNFKHLHKHNFIHSHPIVLSWSSKEAGQEGEKVVGQRPFPSLRKIR